MSTYAGFFQPVRPEMPMAPTAEEQALIGKHFVALKRMLHEGRLIIAGPTTEPPFTGIVVFEAESREAAERVILGDAAVEGGIFTGRVAPMAVSLLKGRDTEVDFGRRHMSSPVPERTLTKSVVVKATPQQVWRAWTSSEGMAEWWATESKIDLKVGGPYELYMAPADPAAPGKRGSEGCRVLSFLPERMLSFEWNAPPQFAVAREQRTHVVILFDDLGDGTVRVTLNHLGWRDDEENQKVYEYFDKAWGYVLGLLARAFPSGG